MTLNRTALSRRGLLIGGAAIAAGLRNVAGAQTPSPDTYPPFADRIGELMAIVPARYGDAGYDGAFVFTYADLARQLASVGLPPPTGGDVPEGFIEGTNVLTLPGPAFQHAFTPGFEDTFGFAPLSIGHVLDVGEPPDAVTIYAGGIDADRVRAALRGSGFEDVDAEGGGSYLTVGDELDLTTDVSAIGVGRMNHAVVADDMLVFAGRGETAGMVAQVMAGLAPSMLEQGAWPGLMATFAEDLVSVMALTPAAITGDATASAMRQFAIGARAGADNRNLADPESGATPATTDEPKGAARAQARIRYDDPKIASEEAEAIARRWSAGVSIRTGQPLTELMVVEDARVIDSDPTVAAIDFQMMGAAGRWYQIAIVQDVEAFVPDGGGE